MSASRRRRILHFLRKEVYLNNNNIINFICWKGDAMNNNNKNNNLRLNIVK